MGFQRRLGLLLTGLTVGPLLLFSWVPLAQPTSLSGTPPLRAPLSRPLQSLQGMSCSGQPVGAGKGACPFNNG